MIGVYNYMMLGVAADGLWSPAVRLAFTTDASARRR